LTGETPFQVDYNSEDDKPDLVHEIINTTPLEPYYLNPSLGRELSNFVMRLLDKESSKRINNWSSYLEKIEELKKTGLSASEEEKKQHQSRSEQARKSFQRRNSIKTFWRKRWKYIIVPVVAIIIVYLITTIDSTAPYVTKDTAPGQVVKYFYQAVNEKDDVLLGQTVDLNLKHLSSMISETHVIEKMRSAYDFQQSKEGENKELFGIKNLQIVEQSTEPEPVFSAHYTFFYNMPQENSPNDSAADSNNGNNSMDTSSRQDQQFKHYEVQMNDQLKLERVNGVWKIAELKGSIDSIISGNLSDLLK
jgi:serine/threonine protein kinase